MCEYNSESPKQGRKRFNSIAKTIHFSNLPITFIYDSGYLPRGLVLSKSFYSLNTSTLRGLPIGWSDLEIKCYTFYVGPNCGWTPIPKCHVFLMPLSFQKIWTVTLKSAHKKLFKVFKACGRGEPIL